MDDGVSSSSRIRMRRGHAATECRVLLSQEDLSLLEELRIAWGKSRSETIRRAIRYEVEKLRMDRSNNQIDAIRSSLLKVQDDVVSVGRRIEQGIEVQRSIERALLVKLEELTNVSATCGVNVMAMIESSNKRQEVYAARDRILSEAPNGERT